MLRTVFATENPQVLLAGLGRALEGRPRGDRPPLWPLPDRRGRLPGSGASAEVRALRWHQFRHPPRHRRESGSRSGEHPGADQEGGHLLWPGVPDHDSPQRAGVSPEAPGRVVGQVLGSQPARSADAGIAGRHHERGDRDLREAAGGSRGRDGQVRGRAVPDPEGHPHPPRGLPAEAAGDAGQTHALEDARHDNHGWRPERSAVRPCFRICGRMPKACTSTPTSCSRT